MNSSSKFYRLGTLSGHQLTGINEFVGGSVTHGNGLLSFEECLIVHLDRVRAKGLSVNGYGDYIN